MQGVEGQEAAKRELSTLLDFWRSEWLPTQTHGQTGVWESSCQQHPQKQPPLGLNEKARSLIVETRKPHRHERLQQQILL